MLQVCAASSSMTPSRPSSAIGPSSRSSRGALRRWIRSTGWSVGSGASASTIGEQQHRASPSATIAEPTPATARSTAIGIAGSRGDRAHRATEHRAGAPPPVERVEDRAAVPPLDGDPVGVLGRVHRWRRARRGRGTIPRARATSARGPRGPGAARRRCRSRRRGGRSRTGGSATPAKPPASRPPIGIAAIAAPSSAFDRSSPALIAGSRGSTFATSAPFTRNSRLTPTRARQARGIDRARGVHGGRWCQSTAVSRRPAPPRSSSGGRAAWPSGRAPGRRSRSRPRAGSAAPPGGRARPR